MDETKTLRLKISALSASLQHEKQISSQHEETIAALQKQLEETSRGSSTRDSFAESHFDRAQRIQIAEQVLLEMAQQEDYTSNRDYAGIIHYGMSVFKSIIFSDLKTATLFKEEYRREMNERELQQRERNEELINSSGIRTMRDMNSQRIASGLKRCYFDPSQAPAIPDKQEPRELSTARRCYICSANFKSMHHFYDSLCKPCAEFNYEKRFISADLQGRVAIVTGGRIRIGYQTVLTLLRNGATVVATTRFPADAMKRYRTEKDYSIFKDRLFLYCMDLRDINAIDTFIDYLSQKFKKVDILVNNAAQTIRKPSQYYTRLVKSELEAIDSYEGKKYENVLTNGVLPSICDASQVIESSVLGLIHAQRAVPASVLSIIPRCEADTQQLEHYFPDQLDDNADYIDLRESNTWKETVEQVDPVEMVEVQVINAVAPNVLVQKIIPLMTRSEFKDRYIINVTSVEGLFSHLFKREAGTHPHTNMAKSALNMLTVTVAPNYAEKYSVYMCAVDPGWISQQSPYPTAQNIKNEKNFVVPLDETDAASRILDPVFSGINDEQYYIASLLKNYEKSSW